MDNKVPQQINDIVGDNVKKLAQLFPSAVKDGEVDFEALKEELGEFQEVGSEKYELTWAGKKNAKKIAQEDVVGRTLKFIPEDSKNADTTENLYIEGDNLEVLKLLRQNYYGAIKMIYIDPPYNTGNDFVYNDSFLVARDKSDMEEGYVGNDGEVYGVNKESSNRFHANWLSMIYPRLKIAKDLLKENGVIFISIDDNECANLKLLCDKIFGPHKFITMIPRITKAQRAGQEKYMDISHDYILCYSNRGDFENIIDRDYDETKIKIDHNGRYIPGDTKAILAAKSQGYSAGGDYDFEYNGKIYKPKTKNGERNRWLWTKERMQAAANLGILVETSSTIRMQLYLDVRFEEGTNKMVPKNSKLIFHTSDFIVNSKYSNANGVQDLNKISLEISNKFNNPKPVELIKKLLCFHSEKDILVLDFFVGSGTTGQAVLELNKEDGGNRRFILCTNNENNICTDVTYPRLKTVITGIRPDGTKYSDGIPANLIYYKTDFIKDSNNTDQAKYCLVEKVDELLCISEDIFIQLERNDYSSHYVSNDEKRHMFIYSDYYNETKFKEFKQRVLNASGTKVVYIFSSDNNVDETLFEGIKDVEVKPIPSKIYEIYKEIVEDIKRG